MNNLGRLIAYIKQNNNILDLQLGEFKILSPLGQGGNGIVYASEFAGKSVAIKFLVTEAKGKMAAQKVTRFMAEYFNVALLEKDTHIVKYLDLDFLIFSDNEGLIEIPLIIMKKYQYSLASLPSIGNYTSFYKLASFLLNAIEQIHDQGVIHRDIKPENILVDNETYVLADFGIAGYNPEIFMLRAETDKKERLGNRLFSAPEQEELGTSPHPTMDFFSFAQVLQWSVSGKTHRGTARARLASFIQHDDIKVFDNIIDICLRNDPQSRFQSISEIKQYIENSRYKGAFVLLPLFNEICRSTFPKVYKGVGYSNDQSRIDLLLGKVSQGISDFGDDLWWHDGFGNLSISKITKANSKAWNIDGTEYLISDVWVNFNSSNYSDFIMIRYVADSPFEFDGTERDYTILVDDNHVISYSEYVNGYAEIEESIISLHNRKVELIDRKREEGFVFLGTRFHCILQMANDSVVRTYVERFKKSNPEEISAMLVSFSKIISENKHHEVVQNL